MVAENKNQWKSVPVQDDGVRIQVKGRNGGVMTTPFRIGGQLFVPDEKGYAKVTTPRTE